MVNIHTKTFVAIILYMVIVYTMMYGVAGGLSHDTGSVSVNAPEIKEVHYRTNYSEDDVHAEENHHNGLLGALIGGLITVLYAASVIVSGGATLILIPIVGTGIFGGYMVGVAVSHTAHVLNVELPWLGFIDMVASFFGSIVDLFSFIGGFVTFGVIGRSFSGVSIPAGLGWIAFIMTIPVWIYGTVILGTFAVEVWNGAKKII